MLLQQRFSVPTNFIDYGDLKCSAIRLEKLPKLSIKNRKQNNLISCLFTNINCNNTNENNTRYPPPVNTETYEPDVHSEVDEMDERKKNFTNEFSQVYVKDIYHGGALYLLKFKATNVRVVPVYLEPRVFESNENDKNVQPSSKSHYYDYHKGNCYKMNLVRKTYKMDKKTDRLNRMSINQGIVVGKMKQAKPEKPHSSISDNKSNVGKSIIYILDNDVYYELYPGIVNLTYTRPLDSFKENTNGENTDKMRNKAVIVVKYKRDVLKFIFDLSEVDYQPVKVQRTVGSQVQDDNFYLQCYSDISDRRVKLPVPRTTYEYEDPMVKVRLNNMRMKLDKVEPLWLTETRRKRIYDYRKCRFPDVYSNMMELKIGSNLNFDRDDYQNKTKFKPAQCFVDEDAFEDWVIEKQKKDMGLDEDGRGGKKGKRRTDEDGEYSGTRFDDTEFDVNDPYRDANNDPENAVIPDWDLVIYEE